MKRSGLAVCTLSGLFALCGCSGSDATSAQPKLGPTSALSVVEVTTVTTVQGSSGVFLSPRPSVAPPSYLEPGSVAPSVSFPGAPSATDRAKVDAALLFKGEAAGSVRWHLDASLAASAPANAPPSVEHFFPRLSTEGASVHWPLELSTLASPDDSGLEADASSEWTGWRAFPGLKVAGAAPPALAASAASLDYDALGVSAPLVLASDGEQMIVTNRSDALISNSLLIYAHPGGVGIRVVSELHPGQQVVTTTGPKEGPISGQLDEARQELSAFFTQSLGAELGVAVAQAKSIPFLETQGMRLVYLLPNLQLPAQITFSEGIAEHRQVVISQAEVLLQTEEASVLSTLATSGSLNVSSATALLGRFTQAKLEYATQSGDAQVSAESSQLLNELEATARE
jgi:hypothetical protein